MEIKELLKKSRLIWGTRKMTLSEIIPALGKVFGDICKWQRNAPKDKATHTDAELKKELGNIIVSTIRWCDDLGYKPEECIEIALKAQEVFASKEK